MNSRIPEEKAEGELRVKMDNAFETGEILKASEETLQEYLWYLCSEGIKNKEVHPRAIVRALTINHIQMQRHIDKLNKETERLQQQGNELQKQNNWLQKIVIILVIVSVVTGAVQIYIMLTQSKQETSRTTQEAQKSRSPLPPTSHASAEDILPSHSAAPSQATPEISHQSNTTSPNTPSQLNPQGAASSGPKERGELNK